MSYYYDDDRGRRGYTNYNLNVNPDRRGRSRSRDGMRDAPPVNIYNNTAPPPGSQPSPGAIPGVMPGAWAPQGQYMPMPQAAPGQYMPMPQAAPGQYMPAPQHQKHRRHSRRRSHSGSSGSSSHSNSHSRHRHGSIDPDFQQFKHDRQRDEMIAEFRRHEEEQERHVKEAIAAQKVKDEREKKAKADAEKAAIAKWQEEEKQKKADRKRIAEEWEREQKEKKEKEDAEYRERMEKDLARFGFKENQVEAIVKHKTAADGALVAAAPPRPTCPKVSIAYLEEKTLRKSKLPYHRDEFDPNFWCIDTPISDEMLQSMFAHTAELRRKREEERKHHLEIEDEKKGHGHRNDNLFVQVRKKDRSRSRSRARDKSPGRGKNDLTGPEKLVERLFLK